MHPTDDNLAALRRRRPAELAARVREEAASAFAVDDSARDAILSACRARCAAALRVPGGVIAAPIQRPAALAARLESYFAAHAAARPVRAARAAPAAASAAVDVPRASLPIGAAWLVERCAQHISLTPVLAHETPLSVAQRVRAALQGDEVGAQMALFELLGADSFEFMSLLMQNIAKLKPVTDAQLKKAVLADERARAKAEAKQRRGREQQSAGLGAERGEQRKGPSRKVRPEDAKLDAAVGFMGMYGMQASMDAQMRRGLPPGATIEHGAQWEEVRVPPRRRPEGEVIHRVAIADLEEWAQLAFPNTTHLNRLQSAIFRQAHLSNENLLVCAPTGAGKTNVAMLCVLNEVRRHIVDGVLQRDAFKIVFVAPMKALAQEVSFILPLHFTRIMLTI